ncbi:MAG: hypothetical protein F6J93_21620 [Oscillatoria sp. SIO1A7]|nr:hypothetical protein [Oscillatoria sp. SIO1A7]
MGKVLSFKFLSFKLRTGNPKLKIQNLKLLVPQSPDFEGPCKSRSQSTILPYHNLKPDYHQKRAIAVQRFEKIEKLYRSRVPGNNPPY